MAVFQFIEGWYNLRRRHSALGYLSPVNYERKHQESVA
jgi:putative transposase